MARRMSDRDIAQVIRQEVMHSQGAEFSDDSLLQNRTQAWNYYTGRPRGDEDPDRSQLQSLDVADMVDHLLSQMMQSFTTDNPCEFEAEGPQDAQAVEMESAGVNHILMEQNHGFTVLSDAIKNALLFKVGICKVCVEDRDERASVTLDGVMGDDADLVEAAAPDEATVDRREDGVTITLNEQRRELVVRSVEPANFQVTSNWHTELLDDCPFVAERHFYRRHELIAMGFPRSKVDKLPVLSLDTKPDALAKRIDFGTEGEELIGTTRGLDTIEMWECYILLPRGLNPTSPESERWKVCLAEQTVLSKERVDIVPYVAGSCIRVPSRWLGLSLFDRLGSVQDAKTVGLRQLADNIAHINSCRLFLKGDVDRETLGFSAPGHHITGSLNSEVLPLPMSDMTGGILGFLEYMDKVRSERGGASIDLDSANSQLLKGQTGATGAALFMGQQEQMAAFYTRTISETLLRQLFLLIHRVAREQWRQPMMLQRAGQFVRVNPASWPVRRRLNVKTGLSPGERARKTNALNQVVQLQASLGNSTPTNVYRALMNWAKCAELDNPEQYFVHPDSAEAQQLAQAAQQQQQQMLQMQMQLQALPEQIKLQIAQMQDKTERDLAVLKAEVEEMKVVGQATAELELEQLRARSAADSAGGNGAAGGNQPAGES